MNCYLRDIGILLVVIIFIDDVFFEIVWWNVVILLGKNVYDSMKRCWNILFIIIMF